MSELKDPFGWVGQTIDEAFLVEEVVGEGGFAVVYRGHHKGFDEKVAVKALKFPSKLGETERTRFLESFTSEGKLLRKLSSANAGIVQALDVGAATSPNGTWTPYLILEWLAGETLESDLKKRAASEAGGRSLADAMALLEPAAKALATAHGMGVAHRDVKPSNLFLVDPAKPDQKRALKVVDFGIAKVMTDSEDVMRAHEATGESIHAFSPKYGAPEQFDRKFGATGPWTDVFALALVLVEVVAGKSAMRGDTSQLFLAASNKSSRPTLHSVGVEESDAVEVVLERALAVDTRERYPSAAEFWEALRHAAEHGETVLSQAGGEAKTRREGRPISSATPDDDSDAARDPSATKPSATAALQAPPARRGSELLIAVLLIGVFGYLSYGLMPKKGLFADTPTPAESHRVADVAVEAGAPSASAINLAVSSMPGFTRYLNERYHYLVDVPDDFTRYDQSSTGDGRTYSNGAGDATLKVTGGALTGSTEDLYKQSFPGGDHSLERWVSTHTITRDSYLAMGFEGDRPFVEKGIVSGGSYARLYFSFAEQDKAHFQAIVQHTANSFSFAAASNSAPAAAQPEDTTISAFLAEDGGLDHGAPDAGKR